MIGSNYIFIRLFVTELAAGNFSSRLKIIRFDFINPKNFVDEFKTYYNLVLILHPPITFRYYSLLIKYEKFENPKKVCKIS